MAAPLFVASEAALKERLRLTAVPGTAGDTDAIIDEAVLQARVRFYTELGVARVNELVALSFTETPTSDDGILRATANTTEVKMVYCILLRSLPNTFMDASGDVGSRWNEESPTRERGGSELDDELKRCENEVVANLMLLAAPNNTNCDAVQTYDGTPVRQTSFPPNTPRIGLSLKCPRGSRIVED